MYRYDDEAVETARQNAEKAREEMKQIIENGGNVKLAIGKWIAANQSYLTILRCRYNI